jgi:hypothetical protein
MIAVVALATLGAKAHAARTGEVGWETTDMPGPDETRPARDSGSPRTTASQHGPAGGLEDEFIPGWLHPHPGESRVLVALAILLAASFQLLLAPQFTVLRPRWLLPGLEVALLASLTAINPVRLTRRSTAGRWLSLILVALISVDNGASAVLLDSNLIKGTAGSAAGPLLASGAAIYLTNIIVFGIWYWELDRGGPYARAEARKRYPDFLFPQMTQHHLAPKNWRPQFSDYLYVSFTNATAFSPTDTMPLTRWAKNLMTLQSAVALSTIALVIARAVNILK